MPARLPTAEEPVVLRFGQSRWTWLFLLMTCGGICVALWRLGIRGIPAVVWFAFCAVVVALFCFSVETQLFSDRVIRTWRLLGKLSVRQREIPLSCFRGVEQRRLGDRYDDISWQVGFSYGTGKFLVVQGFGGGTETEPTEECQKYSRQLAAITGLPLLN